MGDAKFKSDVRKGTMAEDKKLQSLAGSWTPKKTLPRKTWPLKRK